MNRGKRKKKEKKEKKKDEQYLKTESGYVKKKEKKERAESANATKINNENPRVKGGDGVIFFYFSYAILFSSFCAFFLGGEGTNSAFTRKNETI